MNGTAKRLGHRVVVTGVGAVSPLGTGAPALVDGLLAGRSGIGPITVFDPGTLPTRIAGEAPLPEEVPIGDRKIAFALAAANEAVAQARAGAAAGPGLETPEDGAVAMGVGLELFAMQDLVEWRAGRTPRDAPLEARLRFMQTPSDICAHLISARHGIGRPPRLHVSACAAGTDAVGDAFRLVRSGRRRWMLAGGTDSMINPLGVAGFCALSATTERNEEPTRASRPFDARRDGFVMGEGAGVLVLERLEDAEARGATVLAEVLGYGGSLDAAKISDPHPEGRGALLAMTRALEDARLEADAIDAISAHGTSTPKNDPVESHAIEQLLGERAGAVPVVAPKSMIGHLISAAGAVEAVAAIGCMRRGRLHPTLNLDEPDPACRLDYVPNVARAHPQKVVLSASYGFGGHNAAILLGRWAP